jgi:hypothetical protein
LAVVAVVARHKARALTHPVAVVAAVECKQPLLP